MRFPAFFRSKIKFSVIVWHPIYQILIIGFEYIQGKFVKFLAYKRVGIYPARGILQKSLLEVWMIAKK